METPKAAAVWDKTRGWWSIHEIVDKNDPMRSDDRVFSMIGSEYRLRAEEIAAVTGQVMGQYGGIAKVELDNMLERKGYDLYIWLVGAIEVTEDPTTASWTTSH